MGRQDRTQAEKRSVRGSSIGGFRSRRREWLQVGGTAVAIGLAGCLGNNDDDEPQEGYDSAIDDLVANAERFQELADDDEEIATSDIETLEDRLSDAEDSLAIAEDDEGLQEQVGAARDVVAIQRELIEYQSKTLQFENSFEEAVDSWETEEFDQGDAAFVEALDTIDDMRDVIEDLDAALAAAETDPLEEDALSYDEAVWHYIGLDSEAEVTITEEFIDGYREFTQMLSAGIGGAELFVTGEYAEAAELFAEGTATGIQTKEIFEALEENPETPDGLSLNVIEMRQLTASWLDALEYFEEAAEVAQTGDIEEANELYDQGLQEVPE